MSNHAYQLEDKRLSKKRMIFCNGKYRVSKFDPIRKDADLLYGLPSVMFFMYKIKDQ